MTPQRCMQLALADAGASSIEVSHVNAHGTGTALNDLAESAAIEALFGVASRPSLQQRARRGT
ncbi:MAG: hypothetical protein ABI658_21165 [Acidimicrobiales bacterium]